MNYYFGAGHTDTHRHTSQIYQISSFHVISHYFPARDLVRTWNYKIRGRVWHQGITVWMNDLPFIFPLFLLGTSRKRKPDIRNCQGECSLEKTCLTSKRSVGYMMFLVRGKAIYMHLGFAHLIEQATLVCARCVLCLSQHLRRGYFARTSSRPFPSNLSACIQHQSLSRGMWFIYLCWGRREGKEHSMQQNTTELVITEFWLIQILLCELYLEESSTKIL